MIITVFSWGITNPRPAIPAPGSQPRESPVASRRQTSLRTPAGAEARDAAAACGADALARVQARGEAASPARSAPGRGLLGPAAIKGPRGRAQGALRAAPTPGPCARGWARRARLPGPDSAGSFAGSSGRSQPAAPAEPGTAPGRDPPWEGGGRHRAGPQLEPRRALPLSEPRVSGENMRIGMFAL